jgi:hypothetical protein
MNIGSVPKLHRKQSIGRPGNAQPTIGSGNIWYTQAILLPSKADKPKVRVQPFGLYIKNFDALDKSSTNLISELT